MPVVDERKTTLYVWIACAISMAVIIALWAFTLPLQFDLIEKQSVREPQRWESANVNPTEFITPQP